MISQRESRVIYVLLDGDGWLMSRPGRFTPGKETRFRLYGRLGGSRGQLELVRKISSTPGFEPRTVQLLASRYTDYAVPAGA